MTSTRLFPAGGRTSQDTVSRGTASRDAVPPTLGAEPRTGALWAFRRREPRGALAGAVAPLRGIEVAAVGSSSRLEVPTGLMNLVFGFGDPFTVCPATGPDARAATFASLVSAPRSLPHVGRRGGRISIVETAMTPMAACRVLGLPMRELAQGMYAPADVLGRDVDELIGRMGETADWDARLALLERFLSRRFEQPELCPAQVDYAWRRMRRRDAPTAAQLARELGWSTRHLRRQFELYVGMSPHEVTMVARMQRALHLEASGAPLAEVAHGAGYHDQAHLAKSFRGLLGLTPGRYRALRAASGGLSPLTERIPGHVTGLMLP